MKLSFSTIYRSLIAAAIVLTSPAFTQAQAPGIVTYQGRITNNGAPFTGNGSFRFVIYRDGTPPISYWSNDSSSVGAGMPANAVSLPVSGGLFSVGLGDTTLGGMFVPVPAAIFSNSALRVRIWFSDGIVPPAVIADHPITSVGYALFAQSVPDGSITSGKLAPGAVNSTALANDVTFTNLRLDSAGTETMTITSSTGAGQGGLFTFRNGLGNTTLTLDGDTLERGSILTLYNSSGTSTVVINSDDTDESASLSLRDSANHEMVEINASFGGGQGAIMNLRNGAFQTTLSLDADASGNAGSLSVYDGTGDLTVLIDGDEGNGIGGRITVANSAGASRAELDGQGASGGGELVLQGASGGATVNLRGADSASTGARLEMYQANGARTVSVDAEGSTGGGVIELFKSNGTRTIYLDADSAGDGRISTQVLEITGGSDFSENFDIRSPGALPGMIVRIDPSNPGDLVVSNSAYDRTVAGVVSGAGGVKPGLMMGQRGSVADGQHPVALTGRVFCFVDADRGAIEPGDLITTSDTPGHGMKVTEHARAHGSIVGKAMTPLRSGKGLVLVLVNLQ